MYGRKRRVGAKSCRAGSTAEKTDVTHGKHREKPLSSQECAPDRVVAENNAISDIAENQFSGISQEVRYQKAQDALVKATAEFKEKNCAGLSASACSVKMEEHRAELLRGAAEFGSDFVPVYSDIKSFAEAQSALDYLLATVGIFPPAKGASKLLHGIEERGCGRGFEADS